MADLAQPALADEVMGEPDGGDEAVVEGHHVLDAGTAGGVQHLLRLGGVAGHRLLAEEVLAGLGGGDAGGGVDVVGAAVVEQLDGGVGDQLPPVGVVGGEAVAGRRGAHRAFIAAGDRHQPGQRRRRVDHVGQGAVGVDVGLAHEGVAEHADADLFQRVHQASASGGSDGITWRRKATHLVKPSSTEKSASSCSIESAPS